MLEHRGWRRHGGCREASEEMAARLQGLIGRQPPGARMRGWPSDSQPGASTLAIPSDPGDSQGWRWWSPSPCAEATGDGDIAFRKLQDQPLLTRSQASGSSAPWGSSKASTGDSRWARGRPGMALRQGKASLQVSQAGLDQVMKAGKYIAVYVRAKATNTSNKTLILSKPYWLILGRHKPSGTAGETNNVFVTPLKMIREFNKSYGDPFVSALPRMEIEENIYDDSKGASGNGVSPDDRALLRDVTRMLIAAGELVGDREMHPGQTLETQCVVLVNNASGYDFLETRVYFPVRIMTESSHDYDYLNYSFLVRLDWYSWTKKEFEVKPSEKVNALAIVTLINAWRERSLAQKLMTSTPIKGLEFVNMLQPNRLQKDESAFCPAVSDFTASPIQKARLLRRDQMREVEVSASSRQFQRCCP
jgi:hypothetical protein